MTLLGVSGLLFALSAAFIVSLKGSRTRISVFALLFVLHALASVAFYNFVQVTGGDAHLYYYDRLRIYGAQGLGTVFIVNFVGFIKEYFGGTFFDQFMIFHAIGFWGIIFLVKAFNEIFEELNLDQPRWSYLPLFLPGLHYWTGAIGKDAPLFFAVALAVWACMRFNKRLFALGFALAIMLAVRPHVAMVGLMALGVAALIEPKVKLWIKGLLVALVISGTVYIVTGLEAAFGLNLSSAEGVSDLMAARSSVTEESGADLAIVQGNVAIKLFSFWLRPFFLDAENLMGYIASLENVALLLMFGFLLANTRLLRHLFKKVLYVRFSLIFFVALTAMLAAVNYNVGLALRMKMMAMPCLLVIVASIIAVRAAQRAQQPLADVAGYRPPASAEPAV